MSEKKVRIAIDQNKSRLIALRKKLVLTAQETKEAIDLILKRLGLSDGD